MTSVYAGVVGTSRPTDQLAAQATDVGREIATRGGTLLCGGLGGVMEAAARGAKSAGGITVGILPGIRADANDYVDVALGTGLGEMRNLVLVRSCDVLIAIGGGYGTLSEIAFALRVGTPVVGLDTWRLTPPQGSSLEAVPGDMNIVVADSPVAAVAAAWELVAG